MMIISLLFWISAFAIFYAMIGYPATLKLLGRFIKRKNEKDYSYEPTVAVMVVAHNEERVIAEKLSNLTQLDYPREKLEILVASDNSTDNTNLIVEKFISDHPEINIRIHKSIEHKGKTNAQNETQKLVESEILVMTDANAMLEKNSIRELVSSFTSPDIVYVTGKLAYRNTENITAGNEDSYWNIDLMMREIESRIQTITAGNGALYACRNADYYDFNPIECHDSSMPLYYALKGKRAIFNKDAIAVEKAGESNEDEFKRKVRMNRIALRGIMPSLRILNVFKYKWFSLFYIGHRTLRYSLCFSHLLLFTSNMYLAFAVRNIFFTVLFAGQCLFWIIAWFNSVKKFKNKLLSMAGYYGMTVYAQFIGIIRTITGKSKPVWEKAESTR